MTDAAARWATSSVPHTMASAADHDDGEEDDRGAQGAEGVPIDECSRDHGGQRPGLDDHQHRGTAAERHHEGRIPTRGAPVARQSGVECLAHRTGSRAGVSGVICGGDRSRRVIRGPRDVRLVDHRDVDQTSEGSRVAGPRSTAVAARYAAWA